MRPKFFQVCYLFLATLTVQASPITVEDFSAYDVAAPWNSTADPWTYFTGKTWTIAEGDGGRKVLRSTAVATDDLGAVGKVYYTLEALPTKPHRIILDLQIEESGFIEPGGSAILILSFSKDKAMGSSPPRAFSISVPMDRDSEGHAGLGAAAVRLSSAALALAGEKDPVISIADTLDVTAPFRLEIEVDAAANAVRARVNEDAWSEPVPLELPWSEVRFLSLYQRSLRVEVGRIEFFE